MDLGFATTVQSGGKSQKLNIHAESAVVDGSYIRFWGSKPGESRQELRGQIQANFQTDRLSINACAQTGSSCGSRVAFNDFMMELTIGNEHQPVFFSVLGGSHPVEEQGQLRVEVRTISETPPDGYYTNDAYRSDITVGDVGIGGESLGRRVWKGCFSRNLKPRRGAWTEMIGMAKRCRAAFLPVLAGLIVLPAYADMEPMGEDDMSNVSGQYGGMSLSGIFPSIKMAAPCTMGYPNCRPTQRGVAAGSCWMTSRALSPLRA